MLHCYQVVATGVLVLILLNVTNNLHLLAELEPEMHLPSPIPLVSVLVPARDEEEKIGPCLRSLLAQDYPELEILVLDDDSRDRTAEIVEELAREDARLKLLKGAPLPQGWHGKAHACHQLAEMARGDYLLFTDADTIHSPHSVPWAVRLAEKKGADLVTVFPHVLSETFWEVVIMPIMHFALLSYLPLRLVEESRNPWLSIALGPFMFFRRTFYREIGGHASVKGDITEDVWLGRLVKRAGGRLILADGTDVIRIRFYRGLGEVWRGLSKSIYATVNYSTMAILTLIGFNLLIFVAPYYFLYLGWLNGYGGSDYVTLPLIQVLIGWGIRLMLAQRFRQSRLLSFLHPLTVAMGTLIALNSVRWNILGGGTSWKGRTYSVEDGYLLHRHSE